MNLTLPGVSTPTHTSTGPRGAAPEASRQEPAANAQRFGQAMREAPAAMGTAHAPAARPKAAPTSSAISADGSTRADAAADDRADASVDTATPGATASTTDDTTGRASDGASDSADNSSNGQPPSSDAAQAAAADWLSHLPAQSAPIGLNLSLVSGLHPAGASPADRGGDAGTQASTDAASATRPSVAAVGGDATGTAPDPAVGTAARPSTAAPLATAAFTGLPSGLSTAPSTAQPPSSPTSAAAAAAADGSAPSSLASTAPSSRNPSDQAQDGASGDTPRVADATLRTSGDWQLALGRSPAAAPSSTLTLAAQQPTQWREPMLNALGEHVQWQQQRGIDQAVIRLEPPQMGRIDIVIRQDASGLQVQLSATHREVAQQLHAVSDSLRQDLGQRQSLNVSVQVSDASRHDAQGQGGQGGQRSRQPQDSDNRSPNRALQEAEGGTSPTAFALHPEQG